jgi:hypothetical protein
MSKIPSLEKKSPSWLLDKFAAFVQVVVVLSLGWFTNAVIDLEKSVVALTVRQDIMAADVKEIKQDLFHIRTKITNLEGAVIRLEVEQTEHFHKKGKEVNINSTKET